MIIIKSKYLFDGRIKVTSNGVVYKLYKNGEMRQASVSNSGGENRYQRITLSDKGKTLYLYVHRLVAIAFLPNPNKLPEVNHIDGNTQNNNIENLEWCTHKQNVNHALHVLNRPSTPLRKRTPEQLKTYYEERNLIKQNII